MLEGGGGVVERAGAGAQDADALPSEGGEIDRVVGVVHPLGREVVEERRNVPSPGALDAGGEHDVPGEEHPRPVGALEVQAQGAVGIRRRDRRDGGGTDDLDAGDRAVPLQEPLPRDGREEGDIVPRRCAVHGLEPRARTHRRDAPRRPGDVLRGAQRVHARVRGPRPGGVDRGGVEDDDVVDAAAAQAPGEHEPGLSTAHDHDRVFTVAFADPRPCVPRAQRFLVRGLAFEGDQASTRVGERGEDAHSTTTRTP